MTTERTDLPCVLNVYGKPVEVWMSTKEYLLFGATIFQGKAYLEFGMGGSTIAALALVRDVTSVDNNREWIDKTCAQCYSLGLQLPNIHFADQGEVAEWGYPKEKVSAEKYAIDVWKTLKTPPSTIFIDGRFRNACLVASAFYSGFNCNVLLHDCHREAYQETIAKYFDVVQIVDELAVLRRKLFVDISDPLVGFFHGNFRAVAFDPS